MMQHVPMPVSMLVTSAVKTYAIILDSRAIADGIFEDLMQSTLDSALPPLDPIFNLLQSLSYFLQCNSELTMDHKGLFQKRYLNHTPRLYI